MDAPETGGLGGTYAGSPVACAAALAVLDVIEEKNLCARTDEIGSAMTTRFEAIHRSNASVPIGDIRGLDAMVAFELVKERGGHEPEPDVIKPVLGKALDQGLILLCCGYNAKTIRLQTPPHSGPIRPSIYAMKSINQTGANGSIDTPLLLATSKEPFGISGQPS